MIVQIELLRNKDKTARRIKQVVKKFHTDLLGIFVENGRETIPVAKLPLPDYFDFVKNIGYRRDPTRPYPREIIARPYYILKHNNLGHDCKKKAILIASYLHIHNIPYRFIASSSQKNRIVHHIFPQAHIGGAWRNVDATYPNYKLFGAKNDTTYMEVL